jgi:BioD-like phosphotransacetylase family protein
LVSLYITSVEEGAGKTTIGAGLGKQLRDSGQKVAFFKPVIGRSEPSPTGTAESDALFMKQVLGLDEPVESISPVVADWNQLSGTFKEAYTRIAAGKDIVISEGPCELSILGALDARVIAIESYTASAPRVKYVDHYQGLRKHLLGIVYNGVPASKLDQVRGEVTRQLEGSGIDVLGVLPEDRTLLTFTVGELVQCIQGKVLSSAEQSAELIESIMIGAMTVDSGPVYFGRKSNKAVLIRSNRPDMQLAALETATRCLVLCGDTPPIPAVLYGAEVKHVPVILTETDVASTMDIVEAALASNRFRQEKKLPRLAELMGQQLDLPALYKGLGLVAG